jgi:hypothetical protein
MKDWSCRFGGQLVAWGSSSVSRAEGPRGVRGGAPLPFDMGLLPSSFRS